MKTGIIGLPQVGKTSLFKILTKANVEERGHNPREAHLGVATVPDERLDKLSALYTPKKLVHATVEYADVAAIGQEALKESAYANNLRTVDALIHVLRAMEMSTEDKNRIRGFMFLSQNPILYALNVNESTALAADLEKAPEKYKMSEYASRPNAGVTAICGKVEAELVEISDEEAEEFLASYGLTESGLVRLIRKSYELLGLISFFTVGEDECRAWTIERGSRAQAAAGAIHSDLEKHFIRAETIHWDQLLDAGSESNARSRGTLRLEGKEYIVQDGDVMHIRHSG